MSTRFTQSHYTERFGHEEYNALTQNSTATFTVAVQDALAELDARLKHLSLALDPLPELAMAIVADLVRARLFRDNPNPHVLNRQSEARQILGQIADSSITLKPSSAKKFWAKHPSKAHWHFGLKAND